MMSTSTCFVIRVCVTYFYSLRVIPEVSKRQQQTVSNCREQWRLIVRVCARVDCMSKKLRKVQKHFTSSVRLSLPPLPIFIINCMCWLILSSTVARRLEYSGCDVHSTGSILVRSSYCVGTLRKFFAHNCSATPMHLHRRGVWVRFWAWRKNIYLYQRIVVLYCILFADTVQWVSKLPADFLV